MSWTGFLEWVWGGLRRLVGPTGSQRGVAGDESPLALGQTIAHEVRLSDIGTQGMVQPHTRERPTEQQPIAGVKGPGAMVGGSPTSGLWGVVPSALAMWPDASGATAEPGTVFPSGWEGQDGLPAGGRFSRSADQETETFGGDRVRLGMLPAGSRDGDRGGGLTRGASLPWGSRGDQATGAGQQDEYRETAEQLTGTRRVSSRPSLRDTTLSGTLATSRGTVLPLSDVSAPQGPEGQIRVALAETEHPPSQANQGVGTQHTLESEDAGESAVNALGRTPFRLVIHFEFPAAPRGSANILGTPGKDFLVGRDSVPDVLDGGNGGNDVLSGLGGDDTYLLGFDTNRDTIMEDYQNPKGDEKDVIRLKEGIRADQVRLVRGGTGTDLVVELLGQDGSVVASLAVADHFVRDEAKIEQVTLANGRTLWDSDDFLAAEIVGHTGPDRLWGRDDIDDVFDSDAGGNDELFGGRGKDVYLLGYGTGHDWIYRYRNGRRSEEEPIEGDGPPEDVIRLKSGIDASQVRLRREEEDLIVELLDKEGNVSDSLRVYGDFARENLMIERVELWDGTLVWGAEELKEAVFLGHSGDDRLVAYLWDSRSDVMDGGAGNDVLVGFTGNDVYLLGFGTGHDTVREFSTIKRDDPGGDPSDAIRLKSGIDADQVRLARKGGDLIVQLLAKDGSVSDSLTVDSHFFRDDAKIERVELWDGTLVWGAEEFEQVVKRGVILGTSWDDRIVGWRGSDEIMDGGPGGDDQLEGLRGNDVYLLGFGTDHDTIWEFPREWGLDLGGDPDDVIRLKSGIDASQVRLVRSADRADLVVQLLGDDGTVSDSLTVHWHFLRKDAKIERVELWDGALVWDADDFAVAVDGVFDTDTRTDDIHDGHGGSNLYHLGYGTGHDTIREHRDHGGIDIIRVEDGIDPEQVRIQRSANGEDLHVQLLNQRGRVTDSLLVVGFYVRDEKRVEHVQFGLVNVWDKNDLLAAEIVGTPRDDDLRGAAGLNDVFDGDAGGDDTYHGLSGNDVYLLGRETGHDTILEYDYDRDPISPSTSFIIVPGDTPASRGRSFGIWQEHPDRENEHFIGRPDGGDPNDVIRVKSGITADQVRFWRNENGTDLHVQLLNDQGEVTDSLTVPWFYTLQETRVERVELAGGHAWDVRDMLQAEITGYTGDDYLRGSSYTDDIFDGDAGGDDYLAGLAGNDVYLLGHGTGHDMIKEGQYRHVGDTGDRIRVKNGIGPDQIRLWREGTGRWGGHDLFVQVLGEDGSFTDSLRVVDHYIDISRRVETVEFVGDPTVWNTEDFAAVEIIGYSGQDILFGSEDFDDVFDADAGGNDTLYGRGGGDTYLLGRGTGDDVVNEHAWNDTATHPIGFGARPLLPRGDGTDVIRTKDGIGISDVRLERQGDHLVVHLVGDKGFPTDSLTVDSHFTNPKGEVERIETDGRVLLASDFVEFIQEIVAFNAGSSRFATMDLLLDSYWQGEGVLAGSSQS